MLVLETLSGCVGGWHGGAGEGGDRVREEVGSG